MGREARITSEIKKHDRELYCERNTEGKLCIFRKTLSWVSFVLDDGSTLRALRPTPHFVTALTHNWNIRGESVDWGIEPIMARLRSLDLWKRDIVADIEQQEQRHAEAVERDRKNTVESFLSDFRGQFKKTFSDVNTASMEKTDSRKKNEKRVKQ